MGIHRSRLESVLDMLNEIEAGTSMMTDILRKTNMSRGIGKSLLAALLDKGYLNTLQNKQQRKDPDIVLSYIINSQGKEMLKDLTKYNWLFALR